MAPSGDFPFPIRHCATCQCSGNWQAQIQYAPVNVYQPRPALCAVCKAPAQFTWYSEYNSPIHFCPEHRVEHFMKMATVQPGAETAD